MTLYADMLAAGLVTGSHETDLYVRACDESRAILAQHGKRPDGWSVQTFRDEVTGVMSYDIPFAYEPGWRRDA